MHPQKHVILTFLLLFAYKSNQNRMLNTINELITSLNHSVTISAYLCNKKESFQFVNHFSKKEATQISLLNHHNNLSYPIPASTVIFLINFECYQQEQANNVFKKANDALLFAYPFKWIIFSNSSVIFDYVEHFGNFDIFVDSDVTLISADFFIRKIYKLSPSSAEFQIEKYIAGQDYYSRRKNLKHILLKSCLVITNNDSLNHLTDKRDRHIDSITKVDYILVEHLKDTVNATLNYSLTATWGYKSKTKGWSGMIGCLTRKEADIGATALFLTTDRIEIIDYIAMVTPTKSKFIFREPKLSYVANLFTLPFDRYVWASTWALLFIIAGIMFVIVKWEDKREKSLALLVGREAIDENQLNSSLEVVFMTFGALCQQGSAFHPFSIPGRITMIYLFLSFMFLYTSYSANIVALLQSSSSSIQNLEDLLHSRLELGVDDTVFNRFYFPNATEPIRKALYLKKIAPAGQKERFYSISDGINLIRNGLFAFHVETGPGYKFISEIFQEGEKCGLKEIGFLQVPDPWLAIQKNSSYKKLLKIGLRMMQENGVQQREVNLIYTKKPQCLSSGSSFVSVSLVDCYPAVVVLVVGLAMAVFILLFEIYSAKKISQFKRWKSHRNEDPPIFQFRL